MSLFSAFLIVLTPAAVAAADSIQPMAVTQQDPAEPVIAGVMFFGQDAAGPHLAGPPLVPDGRGPVSEDAPPAEVTDVPSQTPPNETIPNEIVVVAEEPPPQDPIQRLNAKTYDVVQELDEALVEPLAKGYEKGLPRPVRKGLSNFFRNLREPIAFLNFLLQGKPGKAVETVGRFAINSTIGLVGLVDVAKKKPFKLPHRPNGFANTLGFYGVKPGAFLVVPLIGPTTVRDLIGSGLDTLTLPATVGSPFNTPAYAVSSYVVRSLDERIEFDQKLRAIRDSDYPYATMRETYLCERQAAIDELHGRERADCSIAPSTYEQASAPAAEPGSEAGIEVPYSVEEPEPESSDPEVNQMSMPDVNIDSPERLQNAGAIPLMVD